MRGQPLNEARGRRLRHGGGCRECHDKRVVVASHELNRMVRASGDFDSLQERELAQSEIHDERGSLAGAQLVPGPRARYSVDDLVGDQER